MRISANSSREPVTFLASYFDFDPANGILRCRFVGKITNEAIREYYQLGREKAELTSPRAAILDLSGVSLFEISQETVRELAKLPPAVEDPRCPRCIIATSPQTFGMARMFEIQGQGTRPNLYIVRSEQEAFAILGVHEPRFAAIAARLEKA